MYTDSDDPMAYNGSAPTGKRSAFDHGPFLRKPEGRVRKVDEFLFVFEQLGAGRLPLGCNDALTQTGEIRESR